MEKDRDEKQKHQEAKISEALKREGQLRGRTHTQRTAVGDWTNSKQQGKKGERQTQQQAPTTQHDHPAEGPEREVPNRAETCCKPCRKVLQTSAAGACEGTNATHEPPHVTCKRHNERHTPTMPPAGCPTNRTHRAWDLARQEKPRPTTHHVNLYQPWRETGPTTQHTHSTTRTQSYYTPSPRAALSVTRKRPLTSHKRARTVKNTQPTTPNCPRNAWTSTKPIQHRTRTSTAAYYSSRRRGTHTSTMPSHHQAYNTSTFATRET